MQRRVSYICRDVLVDRPEVPAQISGPGAGAVTNLDGIFATRETGLGLAQAAAL
jgi:hypothetical protein